MTEIYNLTLVGELVGLVVVISCVSATVLTCLYKFGLIELYQIHKPRILKSWDVCEFCLCFWISATLTVIAYLKFSPNILYIVVPFACASLAKAIYENSKSTGR